MKPRKSPQIKTWGGPSKSEIFLKNLGEEELFYEDAVSYFRINSENLRKPSRREMSPRAHASMEGSILVSREKDGTLEAGLLDDLILQAESCALAYDILSFAAAQFFYCKKFDDNPLGEWWFSTERLNHKRPTKYPSFTNVAKFNTIVADYINLGGPYFTTSLPMRTPDHGKLTTVADAIAEAWGMSRSNVHTALYSRKKLFSQQGIEFEGFNKMTDD